MSPTELLAAIRAAVDYAPVDALVTVQHAEELTQYLVGPVRALMAEAWDEGYAAGRHDEENSTNPQHVSDERNPYRV